MQPTVGPPTASRSLSPPRHSLAFILDQSQQSLREAGGGQTPRQTPRLLTTRDGGGGGGDDGDLSYTGDAIRESPVATDTSRIGAVMITVGIQTTPAAAAAPTTKHSPYASAPAAARAPVPRRSREDRRKARACTVAGCPNYTIDRGLCFRHGGGKQCSVDGCNTSAKHQGLCWKHGGSVGCSIEGCTRGAKSKGLCWSHGGANKCTVEECEKMTISKGLCWTHGGGKRCVFEGCKRPASKKMLNFCAKHGTEVSQVDYVYEV